MPDLSKQTVLIYDASGSYTHVGEAIAPHVKQVLYYSFWEHAFPRSRDTLPGMGLDGIERVWDFDDAVPQADCVVFTDVGRAGLQQRLRDDGIPVWGAGIGCRLEQDRVALKNVLKECGLPVAPWQLVRGLDALRAVLKETEDRWIKFSYFRSDLESFHHLSYFASQVWLDDLGVRLGPYQTEAEFIVEEPIEGHACEVGIDGFLVNGELLTPCMWGYEVKDAACIDTTADMPPRLYECYTKLRPVLQQIRYCGPFSIEARITEDDAYVIDFTARFPSPPSEAQALCIENLAEVIVEGANGNAVAPIYCAPIMAQLVLRSQWGMEHALGLEIGRPSQVAIHGHCRIEDRDYAVSCAEIEEFGGAVGSGATVADAVADAFDAADSVSGYQVSYDSGAFDKALECIREGESLDVPWGRMAQAA